MKPAATSRLLCIVLAVSLTSLAVTVHGQPSAVLLVAANSGIVRAQTDAAQSTAQQSTAKISGRVTGAEGHPVSGAKIEYTDPVSQKSYTMTTGENGEFAASGVVCATYRVTISTGNSKQTSSLSGIVVSPNEQQNVLNIDLSKLPLDSSRLTPEQITAIKADNARATKINAVIIQVNAAMQAKRWDEGAAGARQLTEMDPGNYQFYSMLGLALLNLEQYEEAVNVLDKGILLAKNVTSPEGAVAKANETTARMLTYQGNCFIKLKKSAAAIQAFTKAAQLDPNPGVVNFNLCATYYNIMVYEAQKAFAPESATAAVAACNKALDADPTKAAAYFIKGSMLIAASLDRHGNVTVTEEAFAALKKYLELEPEGPYAAKARALIAASKW